MAERARRIVVGVDESARSRPALAWALQEAAERGAVCHVVTARPPELDELVGGCIDVGAEADVRGHQRRLIESELAHLPVRPRLLTEVLPGDPTEILADRARDADLLVLGARRQGRPGLWRAHRLARRATCPVQVIGADTHAVRRVLRRP
jgi:nucleotide-binding universal stress UspA family protein